MSSQKSKVAFFCSVEVPSTLNQVTIKRLISITGHEIKSCDRTGSLKHCATHGEVVERLP